MYSVVYHNFWQWLTVRLKGKTGKSLWKVQINFHCCSFPLGIYRITKHRNGTSEELGLVVAYANNTVGWKIPELILLACISEEQYRNHKLNQNFRKILQVNWLKFTAVISTIFLILTKCRIEQCNADLCRPFSTSFARHNNHHRCDTDIATIASY